MRTWNMGNTTVRNPMRLRETLRLFVNAMSGCPFKRSEQQEFLNEGIYCDQCRKMARELY